VNDSVLKYKGIIYSPSYHRNQRLLLLFDSNLMVGQGSRAFIMMIIIRPKELSAGGLARLANDSGAPVYTLSPSGDAWWLRDRNTRIFTVLNYYGLSRLQTKGKIIWRNTVDRSQEKRRVTELSQSRLVIVIWKV
jgi:hypothetical protein